MDINEKIDLYLNEVTQNYRKWRNKMLDHIDKVGGKQGSFNTIKLPKTGNSGIAINVVDRMMDKTKTTKHESLYNELSTTKTEEEILSVLKNWTKVKG